MGRLKALHSYLGGGGGLIKSLVILREAGWACVFKAK